jgi:hypothetical protein
MSEAEVLAAEQYAKTWLLGLAASSGRGGDSSELEAIQQAKRKQMKELEELFVQLYPHWAKESWMQ